MRNIFIPFVIFLLVFASCTKQNEETGEISIIPQPTHVELSKGFFEINEKTLIVIPNDEKVNQVADYFIQWFQGASGFKLMLGKESDKKNVIRFDLNKNEELGKEGYRLIVEKDKIVISAQNSIGLFYGVQSLLQLLPSEVYSVEQTNSIQWNAPCCKIKDKPRFGWRGMHLDVSRHFFDVDFIRRYIDLIAMHKMNVFHWHLTDDNGWRIEIKKYPKLTEVSAWRVDREDVHWREVTPPEPGEKATYGGFYTQEEIKEIIKYAAERQITIIPEIEMPGHTSEVFAAYPELSCTGEKLYVQPGSYWPNTDIFCAGKEETFEFIEDVLVEVIELFPAKYIHIGGDEATKTRWEECDLCQTRIKNEGLADEHELQSWLIKRIEKFLNDNGKQLIGWDEILEGGLAPEATVMSWRGIQGGIDAARQGHDVVMSPTSHCYFDYYQANPDFEPVAIGGFTTLKKVYSFEPIPEELDNNQAKHILGAQGNVWTEYIATPEHAEYMSVPRMTALAEVVWSSKENRDWENFQMRLQDQLKRFEQLGVNYSTGSWKVDIQPIMENGVFKVTLEAEQLNIPIYYTLDGSNPSYTSMIYSDPIIIDKSTVIKAGLFVNKELKETFNEKEIVFHKGIGMEGTLENSPSSYYSGNGALSLSDGLLGSDNFRDGYWLGFSGSDFQYEIDLGQRTEVKQVSVNFLQNSGAWIFMPKEVAITILTEDRTKVAEQILEPDATWEVKGTIIENFQAEFLQPEARYIQVSAKNLKKIPDWHEGAGNEGWLFVDEVIIN